MLISAGSGITPMMSILRCLADEQIDLPCTFLYGARTEADILFAADCQRLMATLPRLRYHVRLSQPQNGWTGAAGRVDFPWVCELVEDLAASRFFLCGPGRFMDALTFSN